MNPNEIISMMVMESFTEPQKPQDLKVRKDNGLFFVEFDSTFQYINRQNRNRRIYREPLKQDIHAEHIRELQSKKSWFGEAGHPTSNDMGRIMTIDPTMISHHIPHIQSTGDRIHGRVATVDNGSYGTQMTRLILQGMEPAFSLRALTKLTKRPDGSSIAEGRSHIVCYDWVILPSHKEAYRDESKEIVKVCKDVESSGNTVKESSFIVTENMIADFIALESMNVRLISDIYEVATENMELTKDMRNVILREGNQTFYVKVEDKIQHDIRNFMSNF